MKTEVDDLHFSYPGNKVLQGISFTAEEGEITCVVGPNGSGKSTLIKCLNKLLVPSCGRVLFDGVDSALLSGNEVAQLLGYVPQTSNQLYETTVFDTVLMGRRPHSSWRYSGEDIDVVIDVLSQLNLNDVALQMFNQLSGGQQQRVLLARALAQMPKILLLDEPTSALDIAHQLEVMELIRSLVDCHPLSVFMIVHDLNLVSRYADRVVMVNNGRVHAVGKAVDVFSCENIKEVYSVEAEIRENSGNVTVTPLFCCNKANHLQGFRIGQCRKQSTLTKLNSFWKKRRKTIPQTEPEYGIQDSLL